ncbi:hypothetical protein BH23CHL2_BH23CHL2_09080 [soil metagenome]
MLILAIQLIVFGHLVWLGLYLFARSDRNSSVSIVAIANLALALSVGFGSVDGTSSTSNESNPLTTLSLIVSIGYLTIGLFEQSGARRRTRDRAVVIAIAGGLMTALFGAAFIFLAAWIEPGVPWYAVVILGLAYIAIGLKFAHLNSSENDEAFLPDILRSYDYSFLIAAIFGGQVVLAMWSGPGATNTMIYLLLGTITAAIGIQVYLDRVQGLLDRIAFANVPWLRRERAELRRVENLLPRVNMTDPLTIDEDEFNRLTRRALSSFGDLTKLATSPLTNLPEVHRRLAARGVEPSTLERARELKVLLTEAIEQLKPLTGEPYGTTDEWRFYNALNYPYIVGMRPYNSTAVHSYDDPGHHEVLEWFRTYVPERTLYNWQNAAAGLIAGHLREQEEIALSPDAQPARELTPTG